MAESHEHDFGDAVDLLPAARENGHQALAARLATLQATVCVGCGGIALEAERESETRLTGSEWRGIAELAVDAVGDGVPLA